MALTDYLQRLELAQAPAVNLKGLARVMDRHLLAIPFDNFELMAGRPLRDDPQLIADALAQGRRGGVGHELNLAFRNLLVSLGFHVDLLEAQLYRIENKNFGTEDGDSDYMTLRVNVEEGPYLVDLGMGPLPRQPIAFSERNELKIFGERVRLVEDESWLRVEVYERLKMRFVPLYRFRETPVQWTDLKAGFRWHETNETSPLRGEERLIVAIPDGTIRLGRKEVCLRRKGSEQKEPIADAADFGAALKRFFRIDPDEFSRAE